MNEELLAAPRVPPPAEPVTAGLANRCVDAAPPTTNGTDPDASIAAIQRRTTRVLMVAQIVGTVGVGVAPSIGVLLAGEVTSNEALAGSARTASTLGAALLGIPLGTLAARRGRRVALSTGWWLAAAGAAILVAAAQWSLIVPLFVGLLLIGAGSAVSLQSRFAATDLADEGNRGRALAMVVWVGTFGAVLGPNLGAPGEWLYDAVGLDVFAGAFMVAAICLGIAGVVVVAFLRSDPLFVSRDRLAPAASRLVPAVPAATGYWSRVRLAVDEIPTDPRARIATLAIVTAQIVMVAVMTMTPVHVNQHGGSVTLVGITISLHIAGMYLLSPLVGVMTDRRGHRATILVGVAIFVAPLTMGVLRPDDMGWIVVSLILLGPGWSFVNVAGSALFSTAVTDSSRASAQGGVDALSNLCGATAALLAGPLLVVTSFAFLSLVALVFLVPLTLVMLTRPLAPAGG